MYVFDVIIVYPNIQTIQDMTDRCIEEFSVQ